MIKQHISLKKGCNSDGSGLGISPKTASRSPKAGRPTGPHPDITTTSSNCILPNSTPWTEQAMHNKNIIQHYIISLRKAANFVGNSLKKTLELW